MLVFYSCKKFSIIPSLVFFCSNIWLLYIQLLSQKMYTKQLVVINTLWGYSFVRNAKDDASSGIKGLSSSKRVCLKRVSCFTTMHVVKWWRREETCGIPHASSLLHHFITYSVSWHAWSLKIALKWPEGTSFWYIGLAFKWMGKVLQYLQIFTLANYLNI